MRSRVSSLSTRVSAGVVDALLASNCGGGGTPTAPTLQLPAVLPPLSDLYPLAAGIYRMFMTSLDFFGAAPVCAPAGNAYRRGGTDITLARENGVWVGRSATDGSVVLLRLVDAGPAGTRWPCAAPSRVRSRI